MKNKFLYIYILMLLTALACSGKEETKNTVDEEAAKKMFKKANITWVAGNEVGALKIYKELAIKFPDSIAKKDAEERLLKKNISIGRPLMSWTVQKMTDMENEVVENLFSGNQYNSSFTFSTPKDAWGKEIFYKVYPYKKVYDFVVYSSGPDMKKGTDDDLAIVHYREKKRAPVNNSFYEGISQSDFMGDNDFNANAFKDEDDLLTGSNDNNDYNTKEAFDDTVSLDDLKGMNSMFSSENNSSDNVMSLDQLMNEAKENDFDEDSGDMELSLDEFIEFAK